MVEELLLLSTARNREFELGCRKAATFGSILFGMSTLLEGSGIPQTDALLNERMSTLHGNNLLMRTCYWKAAAVSTRQPTTTL